MFSMESLGLTSCSGWRCPVVTHVHVIRQALILQELARNPFLGVATASKLEGEYMGVSE